jgi:hypothetical protein
MNAFGNALEISSLNHLLRNLPYVKPGSVWYALFKNNPTDQGTGDEVTGGSYARVEITNDKANFPQCAADGTPTKNNGASILFPTATANWGTLSHWAMFDAPSTGLAVAGLGTTNASAVVNIANTSALRVGMTLNAPGFGAGAGGNIIQSIVANTSITMGQNCTATATVAGTIVPKLLAYGPLLTKLVITTGKTPKIPEGSISITLPKGPKGGMTEYAQRKMLDHIWGHLTYVPQAQLYAGLGTGLSGDDLNELDDTAYSRQLVAFNAPAAGQVTNTAELSFTGVDGLTDDVTIPAAGVWDDDTAGNLLITGQLQTTVNMKPTDLIKFAATRLTFTLN